MNGDTFVRDILINVLIGQVTLVSILAHVQVDGIPLLMGNNRRRAKAPEFIPRPHEAKGSTHKGDFELQRQGHVGVDVGQGNHGIETGFGGDEEQIDLDAAPQAHADSSFGAMRIRFQTGIGFAVPNMELHAEGHLDDEQVNG